MAEATLFVLEIHGNENHTEQNTNEFGTKRKKNKSDGAMSRRLHTRPQKNKVPR